MEQMPERESKTRYKTLTARYASRGYAGDLFAGPQIHTLASALVALAEAEQALRLEDHRYRPDHQRSAFHDIDYDAVAREERLIRHDVMSHVHAGDCCPTAKPIIHLGATSCAAGRQHRSDSDADALQLIRRAPPPVHQRWQTSSLIGIKTCRPWDSRIFSRPSR